MLSITLPPELEDALSRSAHALGTTPELLALDSLRERFALQSGNPGTQEKRLTATFGSAQGSIWMSEDFDASLSDFEDY